MIPTFNERQNLPHALASVMGWANRVFILDSGSTDGTQEYARSMGAEVVEHAWEGYARQKNWGLDNLPFESPWVFILDADEAITPQLRDEIARICAKPIHEVEQAGFYVNRYFVFMGKRIRHCGYFPSWNLRLFKRGAARYEERAVHEHMILNGPDGHLRGLMSHDDHRGLEYYAAKHNRYSTLEAATLYQSDKNGPGVEGSLWGNAIQRRRYLRTRIYPRLPAKWLWRFIWMYFIRLGILDGLVGLRFCLFISSHELLTSLKLAELKRAARQGGERESPSAEGTVAVQMTERPRAAADPEDRPMPARAEPPTDSLALDPETAGRARSPWGTREKIGRLLWMIAWTLLFRPSFHNWYGWRRVLLRCFGARIGRGVRIRPTCWIEVPWNVEIGDTCAIGDHCILYSLGKITLGRLVSVSQYAHLCAGTHDYTVRSFPLLPLPIRIGDGVWVAADAFIGPGVTVGDRSVVGARATVMKDVPADVVVAGNPARVIKPRVRKD